METRYYFIFAAVIIALQVFIFIFNRTLQWLFEGKLTPRGKKYLAFITFGIPNAILIGQILQLFMAARAIAFILALLLFSAFISFGIAIIHFLFRETKTIAKIDRTLRLAYPFALAGLLGLSVYNAYVPRLVHYDITLDKPMNPLRIGVASDLHLGSLFGGKALDKLAQIMDEQKVDIILLPGDIMDDNVTAYLAENMRPHLAKLRAPLGVYATLGNHDFFGYQEEITEEIRQAGIILLKDQVATINDEIVLIGRNDDLEKNRPSTATLLKQAKADLPIIVLDHRPSEVEIHSTLPFDLQVSGHTHKGQIFPANLITALTYRIDYGLEKIGNPYFIVTSGYGFWGIPMRLGSQSEIVIIDVKGK
ncbi:metallophosphoesterase [Rodentibacter trehalosifermentans]|uniref:Metallophosphoesterase n=1 Tax=Rodentibacter trehalosifermentans TaxID=1908263 RepID=A0A1V3IZ37_9PAST|nr:metallophosphoesterase [Rodentibacter trehalosifermentans]OOF47460.1 metallophosphoesterase [Rodentibacter trehalosifermentans]OOF48612.1 metallophosphoesterase [Rodentibacter trehalosifermentans]